MDDEMDKGWADALAEAFAFVPGAVHFDTSLRAVDFSEHFGAVEEKAMAQPWDLVLCDLRLQTKDSEGEKRSAMDLSGLKLLKDIKAKHPQVFVVVLIASNKAWSAREVRDAGADGYWVKESPAYGLDEGYSARNAADLLDTSGA